MAESVEIVRTLSEHEATLLAPMFARLDAATARAAVAKQELNEAEQIVMNALQLAYGKTDDVGFDMARRAFVRKTNEVEP